MKNIHFPFAVLVALILPLSALGATETVDGIVWTYTVSGGSASIGSGDYYGDRAVPTSTAGAIVIPSSLGGYPVRSIGTYAFRDCNGLTSVTIPDSVTSIGDRSFQYCDHLTSAIMPDSVTSIGIFAFEGCSALKSVTIGNGLTRIGDGAFQFCNSINAFSVSTGSTAYKSVSGLLLTKDGKTLIHGVNGDVVIPDSVTSIAFSAFSGCSKLMSVTIPESVTSIGETVFYGCSGLTSVTIPERVTSIGGDTFNGCSSLMSVTIPNRVTSIGSKAFNGCNGLHEVVFKGNVPEGLSNSGLPLGNANVRVFYPEEFGAEWLRYLSSRGTVMDFTREPSAEVEISSVQLRTTDPTIMDVIYKVYSTNETVNVRALAFEDGERSFANVVRPETFVEGTGANLGDGIAANVEHTVSWRVSADWAVDLAKVSFEILVSDEGQLPVELVTIPEAGTNAEMTINVSRPTEYEIFNALLWHYADHAEDLTVSNGALKHGNTTLANGAVLANSSAACGYVYGKMGYDLLAGSALTYARSATRWPLATTTKCQYGVLRTAGE